MQSLTAHKIPTIEVGGAMSKLLIHERQLTNEVSENFLIHFCDTVRGSISSKVDLKLDIALSALA